MDVYSRWAMSTQSWVTLIACVGELAVVLLVALRAMGSPLATPLLALSIDLAGWNFAQLAYHRSGMVELWSTTIARP